MWAIALLLWLVIVSVYSDASPYDLGQTAGKFVFFGLISAVILGWSTKTRKFAPVGALLLGSFFLMMGNRAEARARAMVPSDLARAGAGAGAAAAMNAMTRGDSLELTPSIETPPRDSKGNVAWFLKKYSEAYASAQHRMAIEQGLTSVRCRQNGRTRNTSRMQRRIRRLRHISSASFDMSTRQESIIRY